MSVTCAAILKGWAVHLKSLPGLQKVTSTSQISVTLRTRTRSRRAAPKGPVEPMGTLGRRLIRSAKEARKTVRAEAGPETFKMQISAEANVRAVRARNKRTRSHAR